MILLKIRLRLPFLDDVPLWGLVLLVALIYGIHYYMTKKERNAPILEEDEAINKDHTDNKVETLYTPGDE